MKREVHNKEKGEMGIENQTALLPLNNPVKAGKKYQS